VQHLIAILALAACCALWFLVQRWAGRDGETKCDTCETPGCSQRAGIPDPADPHTPGASISRSPLP